MRELNEWCVSQKVIPCLRMSLFKSWTAKFTSQQTCYLKWACNHWGFTHMEKRNRHFILISFTFSGYGGGGITKGSTGLPLRFSFHWPRHWLWMKHANEVASHILQYLAAWIFLEIHGRMIYQKLWPKSNWGWDFRQCGENFTWPNTFRSWAPR